MNNESRLRFLQCSVVAGLLFGIFFSFELWFPINRTFPRVPMFIEIPVWIDRVLSITLIISLILVIFLPKRKMPLVLVINTLILLAISDQMRLQPWVYQYFIIFVVFAFNERKENNSAQMLGLIQISIAALYIWSGLQKINYTFIYETLPFLLSPLQNFMAINDLPLFFVGLTTALTETLIGFGLLLKKTRRFAVRCAIILHIIILTLLVAKNYNQIVWFWNITMIALVIFSFWKSSCSIPEIFSNQKIGADKFSKIIVAASIILPVLSFFGLWDSYLSAALYSSRTEIGVIRINDNLYENLPAKAKQIVFETEKSSQKILPLFEWSINDLNVPVYPEERIFKTVTYKICLLAQDKEKIELIIKKRPLIINGRYDLIRIDCDQINLY